MMTEALNIERLLRMIILLCIQDDFNESAWNKE